MVAPEDDIGLEELFGAEIDALDDAVARDQERTGTLRTRLGERPAVTGTGGFVADRMRRRFAEPPDDELVRRAGAGDARAREELLERMTPWVVAMARRHPAEGLDLADLIQEGYVGVLRALERYDPDRGVPFTAYASWWIRHAVRELRNDFARPMSLSRRDLRELSQLKTEYQRIQAEEGRDPSLAEVAQRIGIDQHRAEQLRLANMVPRSIDETVEVDEGPLGDRQVGPLAELLADPLSDAGYDRVVDRVAGRQLEALLTRLTLIEQEVLRARYGLDDGKPRTQKQVAERLGLSVGRVRQIERRALGKLAREVGEQDGGEAEPGGVRPGADAQQGQAGRARRA